MFAKYRERFADLATEIKQMQRRELPAGWDRDLPSFPTDPKGIAGREASGQVLNVLAENIPWLLGGSADLASAEQDAVKFAGAGEFEPGTPGGRNMHFGVREHAMGAIVNGLSLSKLRAFGSTFLISSDYARPAIRLSAIMELPTIFVFTHDAMGDGEDGPTHQPVEQLISLRAISAAWSCFGLRMPMRWSRPTATSCSCATNPRRLRCRASRCRHSIAENTHLPPACPAAPM